MTRSLMKYLGGSVLALALFAPAGSLAAQGGPAEAVNNYLAGLACEFSPSGRPDYQAALDYYKAAAEGGSREALMGLARLSDPAGPLKGEAAQWRERLKKAAEAGWPEAAFKLAEALEKKEVEAGGLKAADYYFQAALGGHGPAARRLGQLYLQGLEGLPRDEDQAAVWLAAAAKNNVPEAALDLGRLLYQKDEQAAAMWLELSGLPQGSYLLGRLYLKEGRVVEAVSALTVAADQGQPEAHLSLGLLNLDNEYGLRPNPREALKHFKVAARAGLPEGAYQLAKMYLAGQATPKDSITGAFWLHRAAEGGHSAAGADFEKLTLNFTVGQTKRLERMIAEGVSPGLKTPVQ